MNDVQRLQARFEDYPRGELTLLFFSVYSHLSLL